MKKISGLRSALVTALSTGKANNFKAIRNVISQKNYQAIPKNTPMGAFIQKLQKNITPEFLAKTRKKVREAKAEREAKAYTEQKQSKRRISNLSKALKISKGRFGIKTAPTELKQIVGNIIALKNNKGGKGNLAKQVANGNMITKLETALGKLTSEQRGKLSEKIKKIEDEMQKNEFTEKWIVDDAKIKLVKSAIGRVNLAQNTTFGTFKSEKAPNTNKGTIKANVGPPLPPKAETSANAGPVKQTVRGVGANRLYSEVTREQPTYVTRDQMRGPQEQPLYATV
jgi:gas vesicle protein